MVETNKQRFARLRPLAPDSISDSALRARIKRGNSDAACVSVYMNVSAARRRAGLARKKQMYEQGKRIHTFRGTIERMYK